jgi:hypothetical protein
MGSAGFDQAHLPEFTQSLADTTSNPERSKECPVRRQD